MVRLLCGFILGEKCKLQTGLFLDPGLKAASRKSGWLMPVCQQFALIIG
jgi:hypothetical protein